MAVSKTVPALAKVEAKTAAEICGALKLSQPAGKLLDPRVSPAEFLARLNETGMTQDAVGFLAYALPKREAVWWACQCVREAGPDSGDPAKAALLAAAHWVADPSEQHRRAAHLAAEQAESTPESFVAFGAFFSGGSMAPPGAPEVPPAKDLTACMTMNAVLIAAVAKEPQKAPQRYQRFVEIGIQTANQPLPSGKGA
jgi:hypothetical protein